MGRRRAGRGGEPPGRGDRAGRLREADRPPARRRLDCLGSAGCRQPWQVFPHRRFGMRLSIAAAVATFTSAILLHPLFEGGQWFWSSLGVVLAVLAASVLSTRLSLPAWAAPLVSVAALWIFL